MLAAKRSPNGALGQHALLPSSPQATCLNPEDAFGRLINQVTRRDWAWLRGPEEMFPEVGGESGEKRVGAVLLVLGFGEGQAHAPDRLANALGGLERLITRAVVDVG